MADLIDRQEVIDLLKKSASRDIEEVVVTEKNIKLIMDMPKAFDVDAVVAELCQIKKDMSQGCEDVSNNECLKYDNCAFCVLARATDIVRKGWVE